jgi:phenylalanyl-tRNA synthetase beta chain
MKFSYEWIQELSGVKLSVEDGAEQLRRAFEDIEVSESDSGMPLLDIEVLPNRPDALSHVGIARELAALTGAVWHETGEQCTTAAHGDVSIRIEDEQACPRYTGLAVRGVQVGPSPDWMVSRLEALGLKSINNIVDVANYVMLETGQPMHVFDIHKLTGGIVVRRAKKGESLKALDEAQTEYALNPSILVIADKQGPVAIAGIKGGEGTGVTEQTHDILLEAATFDASAIRRGSMALGLRTDASVRFSYGVPPELTTRALALAARLLDDIAGGAVDGAAVDAYPRVRHPVKLVLNTDYTRSLLGADISDGDIFKALTNLGFEVAGSGTALQIGVPSWRLDISRQEDLIEEVGRMFGYENIPSVPPVVHAFDERGWLKEEEDVVWDEASYIRERYGIGRLLAGDGYTETYSYSFLSDELVEIIGLEDLPELTMPQSSQFRWLRTSLVPRLLLQARDNLRFTKAANLFETGHVFFRVVNGKEPTRLSLIRAAAGNATKEDVFYELKGSVEHLLAQLGITDTYVDDAEPFSADAAALAVTAPGRQAAIKDGNGTTLGFLGQIHPAMAGKLKLKGRAAIAELDLRALISHAREEREFASLPKYPAVERDISMLVAADIKIARIMEAVQGVDTSGLVRDVDVLDIFVPTGKEKLAPEDDRHDYGKSVAVRIVFRSDERTLTDDEVTIVEDAIKQALRDKLEARIR